MPISLRQKKIFKTKCALAEAFIEKLKTEKFEAISIKDICVKTDVSEATFFNYFPQKVDIIAYLLKAKLFKIYWDLSHHQTSLSFPHFIEKAFELIAKEIQHPYVFFEIIPVIGTRKMEINSFTISPEELQFLYPECLYVDKIRILTLHDFFKEKIETAIAHQQIPETICPESLLQFLMTIFNGVPLSIPFSKFSELTDIYRRHLSLLWKIFKF